MLQYELAIYKAGDEMISAAVFDGVYARRAEMTPLRELDLATAGNTTLRCQGCSTVISELSLESLKNALHVAQRGAVGRASLLLDFGCGTGAISRWLAGELTCNVMGIDHSQVAVAEARRKTQGTTLPTPVFVNTDFRCFQVRPGSVFGAVSLDALYLADVPSEIVRRLCRAMATGAVFYMTAYDTPQSRAAHNWMQSLQVGGFTAMARDITKFWRAQMRKRHELRWEQRDRLRRLLSAVVEPELQVSSALIGRHGIINSIYRYEIYAWKTRKHHPQS